MPPRRRNRVGPAPPTLLPLDEPPMIDQPVAPPRRRHNRPPPVNAPVVNTPILPPLRRRVQRLEKDTTTAPPANEHILNIPPQQATFCSTLQSPPWMPLQTPFSYACETLAYCVAMHPSLTGVIRAA